MNPRVLTYGDLAFIEWALMYLLLDGRHTGWLEWHKFAAITIGVMGGWNFVLAVASVFSGKRDL